MSQGIETAEQSKPAVASPRTWLLLGRKPGDNGQVLALAEALGWSFTVKHLVYRPWELVTNRLLGPTLLGVDRKHSSPLQPPWPELVISAGRRSEPVARWIQARAGGRQQVKLVHVGRPWAATELFDLIISTPQYALPLRPNILHNEAPMNRVSSTKLAAAAEQWRHRLEPWGRPWIAVMLGGHVGPYTFTPLAARHLAAQVSAMATSLGGSLLISSSARTPQGALNAFAQALDAPHFLYRWRADDPENPYLGLLALADRIVVTSDSMSMLVEAVATGKPVFIFDLGSSDRRSDGALGWLPTRRELVFHLGRLFGPAQLARDVGAIHRAQVTAGRAVWLGQSWMLAGRTLPLEDTSRAAARVRELFKNQQAV